MPTRIADQFDDIRARRDELRDERAAAVAGCICSHNPDRATRHEMGCSLWLPPPAPPCPAAERVAELRYILGRHGLLVERPAASVDA